MTAAVLALVAPAYGVAPAPQIRIEPTTLYFGAATPPAASAAQEHKATLPASSSRPILAAALKAKAADGGTVRVIVQLATPFTPEGRLAGLQIRGQAQDAVLLKLAGPGAKLHARYGHIPFLALEVDAATLDRLAGLPEVAGIAEDAFEKPSLVSSNAVIGSGVAWSMGLTGAGQTIAILDTGVDKTHPYFASGPQNKVVSEACYSSNTSLPGYYPTTTVCPGGVTESTAPGSGVNCSLSTSVSCEHGTHVAGIAAGNDGVGPAFGVARDANVIAIQVFSSSCYGTCIGSWISDQIKGLERVYELADQYHIAAVNMSLGGYPYETRSACDADNQATKAAIDNLRSLDIPTVAAAGNDYSYGIDAPACISSTIAVSATDDADIVPYFANIHPDLDLMAPGVAVDSSIPGGGTASLSGTSMSAPHVAGAWAILRQQNSAATVADVRETLRATAVQVGGFGYDLRRINLGKAVTAGPFVTRDFVIYNDGNAVLSVLSEQLETPAAWIRWTPEAPFDVPPGGSRHVSVTLDFGTLPAGASSNRLIVGSTDGARSPYPDAVHLVIDKEACYPLTRLRDGTGGYPDASPSGSPGCPAGQYYAGQAIQLTGRPGTGWGVQAWSGTDNDASTAGTNTLTMPAAPRTVKATYYALCYSLSLGRTGSGSDPMASPANSVGCPAGQYRYAEPIQLTAAPSRGWRVGGWTNTGADASHKKTNSLAMPAASAAVSVNYTEGLPSALLVVDSSYSYYASPYTAALTSLGTVYDVWNLATGNPDAATLAQYPRVIWESGYYLPTTAQEGILTIYLAGGGSLFLSSQQDYGATSFFQSYLGVAGLNEDFSYNLTGQGSALSGLGPFSVYPWNTTVTPAAGAEVALQNEYGQSAGVSKIGPSYRTLFVGSAFQNLDLEDDQRTLLGASLDFLGTVFADIPRGYWAKKWIEAMYRNGVTSGCSSNPRQYCPEAAVTRGQMAVFLLLAKEAPGYSPPPCATAPFNDVPASNPLCPWIKELARRGVTSGCGGGSFCPDSVVTRDQMSVFLLSTLEGPGYAPPACLNSTPFVDVPASSPFCPWVAELARRGISSGCNPGTFCPSNPVNRAQMAVFLVSNFHLPIF
jgi:subtilisin family serine protease